MVTALAMMTALAAGPEYSVVVARRIGVDVKRAADLAAECAAALEADEKHALGALVPVAETSAKLAAAGFPDPSVCNGAAACVATLAKVSGLTRLVSLQLVKAGPDLAIDASVVDVESGKSLAAVTRTVKLKNAAPGLRDLAAELLAKLPAEPTPSVAVKPKPADDGPRVPSFTLEDTPPPLPAPAPKATAAVGLSTGRKVAIGFGIGAIAALGTGIGLGVGALLDANRLRPHDADFAQKAAAVQRMANFADVSFGTAAAFAITALLLWLLAP